MHLFGNQRYSRVASSSSQFCITRYNVRHWISLIHSFTALMRLDTDRKTRIKKAQSEKTMQTRWKQRHSFKEPPLLLRLLLWTVCVHARIYCWGFKQHVDGSISSTFIRLALKKKKKKVQSVLLQKQRGQSNQRSEHTNVSNRFITDQLGSINKKGPRHTF